MVENKKKCNWSDEGFNSLVSAIINSAEADWNIAARSINRKGNNNKDIYQLKQIIDFVQSDWFRDLTNHTCAQDEAVKFLLEKITNKDARVELDKFVVINKKKWENSNSYHKVNKIKY